MNFDPGFVIVAKTLVLLVACFIYALVFYSFREQIIEWLSKPWPPRKGIETHVYPITLKHEIINGLAHVLVGLIVTYTFIMPVQSAHYSLLLTPAGFIRERWQWWRGKVQPRYIQIIDVITIVLGGYLAYFLVWLFNINLDTM